MQQRPSDLYLVNNQFWEEYGKLELLNDQSSPSTKLHKSQNNKLIKETVFQNEDDFRQWLRCLQFEIKKQNEMCANYKNFILRILHYSYERKNEVFKFYIAYDCNPSQVKPLFEAQDLAVPNNTEQLINLALQILQFGIILQNTGVCHANIKPSNFFRDGPRVLITDFGSMRTHYRNYNAKYTNKKDVDWKNYNLNYRSNWFQGALNSQGRIQSHIDVEADIWALGMIILQIFQSNPLSNFEYWKTDKKLKDKIDQLRNRQFCAPVADALTQLLLVKKVNVRNVFDELWKARCNTPKPQNFLKRKPFQIDKDLLYAQNLEKIKDHETDLKKCDEEDVTKKIYLQRGQSRNSYIGRNEDDSQRLITDQSVVQINQGESVNGYSPLGRQNTFYSNNNQQVQVRQDSPRERPPLPRLQQQPQEEVPKKMITIHEYKELDHIRQEEKLAELFDQALIERPQKVEILSTLNFILEYFYENIDLDTYKYPSLGATWELEGSIYKEGEKIQINKTIPINYLPYLKKFPGQISNSSEDVGTLNGLSHGLGSKQTDEGLFQGIFHLGRFLWGTLYESEDDLLYERTGPFHNQLIHGKECEMIIHDSNDQIIEHYKGEMESGVKHGKGVLKQGNKKTYGTWVQGKLQGEITEEIRENNRTITTRQVILKENCEEQAKKQSCSIF